MALLKKTDEGKRWRLERIKNLTDRRDRIKRLEAMKSTHEWTDLKEVLESFVKFADNELKIAIRDCRSKEHDDGSIAKRICEIEQKKDDFQLVVDLVENSKDQVEHLNMALDKASEEYKTYLQEE